MRRDAAAAALPRCRHPATMPRPSRRPFSSQFVLLGAVLDSRLLLQWEEMDRLAGLPPPEQARALHLHAHPPLQPPPHAQVHSAMVSAMLPGSALQIPSPAAHLLAVLQAREAQAAKPDA